MSGERSGELTTVVMTYNLWGTNLWPQREPALRALFATRDADLIAVQELSAETRDVLDDMLPNHRRVEDSFAGWTSSSNLWWRTDLFTMRDHGAHDIGARKTRRLFWVRLTPAGGGPPLLFATAHYTWPGDEQEERTGVNPRIAQARRTVAALDELAADGPCLFVGDLNDHHHPVHVLRKAGFQDSFTALGRSGSPTSPVLPLIARPEGDDPPKDIPKVIDFQFSRGPIRVRTSEVVQYFHHGVAPSDHRPVVATYSLPGTPHPGRRHDHLVT